MVFHLVPVLA